MRLTLDADSRSVGNIKSISAVGWAQNFNQVNAELNLPPGWRLLAASGVDNVPDTWIARWTLLDLFLVLIAALATSRLFGRRWGLFALLTLVLIWHEAGSPQYVWLNILAATALIKSAAARQVFDRYDLVSQCVLAGISPDRRSVYGQSSADGALSAVGIPMAKFCDAASVQSCPG